MRPAATVAEDPGGTRFGPAARPWPLVWPKRGAVATLADSPGGRVLDVDVDDDTGNYEVEVLGADGTVVDVTLDRDLRVLDRVPDLDRDDADDRS